MKLQEEIIKLVIYKQFFVNTQGYCFNLDVIRANPYSLIQKECPETSLD